MNPHVCSISCLIGDESKEKVVREKIKKCLPENVVYIIYNSDEMSNNCYIYQNLWSYLTSTDVCPINFTGRIDKKNIKTKQFIKWFAKILAREDWWDEPSQRSFIIEAIDVWKSLKTKTFDNNGDEEPTADDNNSEEEEWTKEEVDELIEECLTQKTHK